MIYKEALPGSLALFVPEGDPITPCGRLALTRGLLIVLGLLAGDSSQH
jgi:hypothetical protein